MTGSPDPERRVRVRLLSIEEDVTRDARCLVRVRVEGLDGRVAEGMGEGPDTPGGRAKAGAEAALGAECRVTLERLSLQLRGVKTLRAFDAHLVVVSLRAESSLQAYELIGSAATPDDEMARGGTLAVLDATNRILEKYVRTADDSGSE